MKKNASEMIRSILESGEMNSTEIHAKLDAGKTPRQVRSLIREMINLGHIVKTNSTIPYKYRLAKVIETEVPYTIEEIEKVRASVSNLTIGLSEKIRIAVNILPMTPKHIAVATGATLPGVHGSLFGMAKRGLVERMEDGRYKFVKEPILQKKNRGQEKLRNLSIAKEPQKKVDAWKDQEGQSVEDWIANGGVIDRTPFSAKFENLTHEEIAGKVVGVPMGYLSPVRRSSSHF